MENHYSSNLKKNEFLWYHKEILSSHNFKKGLSHKKMRGLIHKLYPEELCFVFDQTKGKQTAVDSIKLPRDQRQLVFGIFKFSSCPSLLKDGQTRQFQEWKTWKTTKIRFQGNHRNCYSFISRGTPLTNDSIQKRVCRRRHFTFSFLYFCFHLNIYHLCHRIMLYKMYSLRHNFLTLMPTALCS